MASTRLEKVWSSHRQCLNAAAVLTVFCLGLGSPIPNRVVAAQGPDCSDGCPLALDEPVTGSFPANGSHQWLLNVPGAGLITATVDLSPGERVYLYGPDGLVEEPYTASANEQHLVTVRAESAATIYIYLDNPTGGSGRTYSLLANWTEAKVASEPSAPSAPPQTGSVLFADDFSNPTAGLLRTSGSPGVFSFSYETGRYRIRKLDPSYELIPVTRLPGTYSDTALSITGQLSASPLGLMIITCRTQQDAESEYRLVVVPEDRTFWLMRRDGRTVTDLAALQPTEAISRGDQPNRLELICSGSTIAARINGTLVASVRDDTYTSGTQQFGAFASNTTVDAWFDALAVTAEHPSTAPAPFPRPARGSILLADTFSDAQQGFLPRESGDPSRYRRGYVAGEYVIQITRTTSEAASTFLPGSFGDSTLAVDGWVAGANENRVLVLICRRGSTDGGYGLVIDPGGTRALLQRYDSPSTVTIVDWSTAPSIRAGAQRNRVELTCEGASISGRVNGATVVDATDATYRRGSLGIELNWLGTAVTGQAHFDNLVVTQR